MITCPSRVERILRRLAEETEGVGGKYRLSAGITLKGHLISTGVNSYKTSPWAVKYQKNPYAIYLHAEVSCISGASRLLTSRELRKSTLWVMRIKKDGSYGLSMPCVGCLKAIAAFDIQNVMYTTEEQTWEQM